ncbi:hypothetical protein F1880_002509 [Penicillium rolfsii]|nr:hypothetical protein F1880_002509 [Penicillium rolfsii]
MGTAPSPPPRSTCKAWPWSNHAAGSDIHSYHILLKNNDTTSTTLSASFTSTTSTSTPSSSTQTSVSAADTAATKSTSAATTTPIAAKINTNTGKSSSLSGGAIAGVIVGVLAELAIAGILIFFLCWRSRKKTLPSTNSERPIPPMSELGQNDEKPSSPSLSSPISLGYGSYVYQGQKLPELPGSVVATEMGPGVLRAELDDSTA